MSIGGFRTSLICVSLVILCATVCILASCECNRVSSLAIALASFAETPNDDKLVAWLKEQSDFFVHPSLTRRASGDYFVKEGAREIKESELLMVIPASAIVSVFGGQEDQEKNDHGNSICNLYEALRNELELKEESDYAPYIQELVALQSNQQNHSSINPMPSAWSLAGRSLLTLFNNGSPPDAIVSLLEEYMHCLTGSDPERAQDTATSRQLIYNSKEENLKDPPIFIEMPANNRAIQLTPQQKDDMNILEMALQHQIERQFLVPLYDQMDHHHYDFNVVHQRNGGAFHVIATRSLKSGEMLTRPSQTCLKDCNEPMKQGQPVSRGGNMLGALKLFGQVQRYPHVWEFGLGVSFIYHGIADDLLEENARVGFRSLRQTETIEQERFPSIEWIATPTEDWQLDYMEGEISRQRQLIKLELETSVDTVPALELHQVQRYSNAVLPALSTAVKQGRKFLEQRNKALGKQKKKKGRTEMEKAYLRSIGKKCTNNEGECSRTHGVEHSIDEDCDPLTECSFEDIEGLRKCSDHKSRPTGERDAAEWQLMQTAYVNAVGAKNSTIPSVPGSGFRKKYRIAHSPGRGRGVFAMEDIPKGTLIWSNNYTAYFEEGNQFRRFLAALPDDIACDLLIWCYTIVVEADADDPVKSPERPLIGCDLDAASLMNSYNHLAEYNAGTVEIPQLESDLMSVVYAARDIKAGEEMVSAYDEFDSDNYGAFGL